MPDPLAHVLAKSADPKNDRGEQTLTGHTASVLSRLSAWRDRCPAVSVHARRDNLWQLAAWAVVLHDVGKIARGFQERLRSRTVTPFDHRHEVLSLAVVGALELDPRGRALVAAGVVTHHKDLPEIFECYDEGARDELVEHVVESDLAALERWLTTEATALLQKHSFEPLPRRLPISPRAAIDESLRALWALRRELHAEPSATTPGNLAARAMRGLVVLADHAGSANEKLPSVPSLDSVANFRSAAASSLTRGLSHHQALAAETDGHAILVAPTGSGKTEAALLWAARQRERGPGKPVVFYILPYRASLNAMRSRIEERYGVPPGAIVLQHAKAASALFSRLREKEYDLRQAQRTAIAERALGRLMTPPIRVSTPFQLLRAIFGAKGHEAMLTDAVSGAFILDELHAYDLDRLGLILAALRHLARECGGRMLAMSATMPTVLREAVVDMLGCEPAAIDADDTTKAQFRRHELHVVERDLFSEESFADVERRFGAGEAVLVVASTVARAQSFYDQVLRRLGTSGVAETECCSLLHGRFTAKDRNAKETALAQRLATGRRVERPTLVVSTQVVEVSLDVDFDVLFSDPAPIEALLQRFGRVNRGCRGGLRDVVVHAHQPKDATFYPREVVERALAVLRAAQGAVEEGKTQAWVDAVYAPIAKRWQAELKRRIDDAVAHVVDTNWPLESQDLDRYFDTFEEAHEVVPAIFAADHERLVTENPLAAMDFLVPITANQARRLAREGKLSTVRADKHMTWLVADVSYSSDRGLTL